MSVQGYEETLARASVAVDLRWRLEGGDLCGNLPSRLSPHTHTHTTLFRSHIGLSLVWVSLFKISSLEEHKRQLQV